MITTAGMHKIYYRLDLDSVIFTNSSIHQKWLLIIKSWANILSKTGFKSNTGMIKKTQP